MRTSNILFQLIAQRYCIASCTDNVARITATFQVARGRTWVLPCATLLPISLYSGDPVRTMIRASTHYHGTTRYLQAARITSPLFLVAEFVEDREAGGRVLLGAGFFGCGAAGSRVEQSPVVVEPRAARAVRVLQPHDVPQLQRRAVLSVFGENPERGACVCQPVVPSPRGNVPVANKKRKSTVKLPSFAWGSAPRLGATVARY